jgi:hypothetical protein
MSYPNADAPVPQVEPAPEPLHTEAEEEMLEALYAELKPEAIKAYLNYFLSRTPPALQHDMHDLIKDDISVPPEPPPPEATRAGEEQRRGLLGA